MMLLQERLEKSTKNMKALDQDRKKANDLKRREANDKAFHDLVFETESNLKTYKYAKDHFNFKLSQNLQQEIQDYIQNLKNTIDSNTSVDEARLSGNKRKSRNLLEELSKQWSFFYQENLTGYKGSLNILDGLGMAEGDIGSLRKRLESGRAWSSLGRSSSGTRKDQVVVLAEAVDKINQMLAQLTLTDGIKRFLIAVSQNRADVTSLTPEVYDWIHKKQISTRFSISFKRKSSDF